MAFAWSASGAVEVEGVRLGYYEAGDPAGRPVVMLHGSGSSARTWDRFADRLAATGHRPIAVDLRGHGTSARTRSYPLIGFRDDLLGLLDALSLRDTILVGHSVGAYAAMAAARHAPDRVAALILEDPPAPPRQSGPLLPGVSPVALLVAAATIVATSRDYDLRAMRQIFRQLSRPDPSWWSGLTGVRQPALVLSGGPASLIPPQRLADLAAALPDGRLVTIPVGHRVHSLGPDQFATGALAFLSETAPTR